MPGSSVVTIRSSRAQLPHRVRRHRSGDRLPECIGNIVDPLIPLISVYGSTTRVGAEEGGDGSSGSEFIMDFKR